MKPLKSTTAAELAEIPSNMAVKHEGEIAALKTGLEGIQSDLRGYSEWMQKIERGMETNAAETRALFTRATQRNPSVWVGIGSLLVMIILGASALTIFTINGVVTPIKQMTEEHRLAILTQDLHERDDFKGLTETKRDLYWIEKALSEKTKHKSE